MTPEEFISKLRKKKDQNLVAAQQALEEAARLTHNQVGQRIFLRGIAADESRIGKYSTKPLLVSKKAFVNKSAFKQSVRVSKNGKTRPMYVKFPNNKKVTPVMVLPGGYAQLRNIQGMQSSTVDLTYSGKTKRMFIASLRRFGRYSWSAILRGNQAADRGVWNEQRFGKRIFELTNKEKQFFSKQFIDSFNRKSQIT